ncbi:MAG: hypothetical protein PHW10_06115 [Candidatus Peribacteraceae bacterium]|nr:hypothetical protein [Candidatus Peribacteraceae bacterium]
MFSKKSSHKPACLVAHLLVAAVLLFTSVAALVGVYLSHVLSSGLVFGTSSGSLSIIAFVVSVMALGKQVRLCCEKCACCGAK